MQRSYGYYRDLFAGRLMPFAFVDLDLFDANVAEVLARARGKAIRVASKSMRCVALLRRVFAASSQFQGLMAYSLREAAFLAGQGFDDILVAYPAWGDAEAAEVRDMLRGETGVTLMVDCAEQVEHWERVATAAGVAVSVCLDVDMSSRYPGLHFGVRRSGITTPAQALKLWARIRECEHVTLAGVMGYEAQIAGLQDRVPRQMLKNRLVDALKRRSVREVARRRAAVVDALRNAGCDLRFVNGGGTGSVETTRDDPAVTELTVGSGFYAPGLFDHFSRFKHLPAAGFAIEITRQPTPEIYTCLGGGYVASGAAGPDKLPTPYLPAGARLIAQEGAGEVQTPIVYNGSEQLVLGAPVFLRHSKAGELCERFNTLLLASEGKVVDEVPTYRGEGQCFL